MSALDVRGLGREGAFPSLFYIHAATWWIPPQEKQEDFVFKTRNLDANLFPKP